MFLLMKKLLSIVVIGLLLTGNSYADLYSCNIIGKQNIPPDEDLEYRALIKFLYANFPDFNSSDLGFFAKELFKEEIKKDREKLFEYGKIDLKPYYV